MIVTERIFNVDHLTRCYSKFSFQTMATCWLVLELRGPVEKRHILPVFNLFTSGIDRNIIPNKISKNDTYIHYCIYLLTILNLNMCHIDHFYMQPVCAVSN